MKNNPIKYLFVILIQLLFSTNSTAQLKIKGIVFDEKNKKLISSANILEENTTNRTLSDSNGKFNITVSDTATIRIYLVGYQDKIINATNYQGDTIRLEENTEVSITDCAFSVIVNDYFFGYYGDINKYPYGFSIFHKRNFLFGKYIGLSGQINYKTDTKSNYDFKFILTKTNLMSFNHYKLSAITSFQKRKHEKLNINDYEFILENYIQDRFSLLFGYAIKKDFTAPSKQNKGVLFGVNKYVKKTLTYISSDVKFFKNVNEYNLTILQRITLHKKFWGNLRFGFEYHHYKDYDEFNIIVRYVFSKCKYI